MDGPGGYAAVVFDWDGNEVVHGWDYTKAALFERGLVFLGPEFERRVPTVDVTIEGRVEHLRGCVRDPEVHAIVGRFFKAMEDGTFRPGPA